MANLNRVMLMGNLTRDPELTYLPNGNTAVVQFGLAVNRTWTGQDGVKKEEVTFVDVTMFGKLAEVLAKYKKRGDPLFVEGRLKLDQWEDQSSGAKRSKLKVIGESFQFLNRSAQRDEGGEGGEYQGEEPAAAAPKARAPFRPSARPGQRPAPSRTVDAQAEEYESTGGGDVDLPF